MLLATLAIYFHNFLKQIVELFYIKMLVIESRSIDFI